MVKSIASLLKLTNQREKLSAKYMPNENDLKNTIKKLYKTPELSKKPFLPESLSNWLLPFDFSKKKP